MVLGGETEAERGRRVQEVIRDCIRRRVGGETLPNEAVASDHPDLMPELGQELQALALIQRAEQCASDTANHANGISTDVVLPADSFPGYEIIGEIHRGGQGVVYEALQKSTQRKVAIKAMKEGTFGRPGDRTRFEREVQILGQLKHPRIVTIYDSGSAAAGFYFVMDYIAGNALDEFMAGQERSIPETLELFARVCDAVNAAHLHGIIHRDLKPSNIRVDPQEDPHILDFGLAKVAAGEDEHSGMTLTGQFVGSVPWASPEQAEGIPQKIDMRTDVYSLGMILHHMLTGCFPYEVAGNIRDVIDNILKAEPTRPSTIRKQIDNEVETIVLKCLAKEPDRRYQTAGELVRDIRRYLAGEPIEAKRDSVGYVLRKHLRRYRIPVAIAGAFALVVTIGFFTSLMFWRDAVHERDAAEAARAEAKRQAEIAQAVNDFLNKEVLAAAGPYSTPGREITIREVLDVASEQIQGKFAGEPLVEAALRTTLGDAYRELGRYDSAESHIQRALELIRGAFGQDHPHTLATINKLASVYCKQARFHEAEPLLVQTLEARRRVLGDNHQDTLMSINNLAKFLAAQGRYDEAEPLYSAAIQAQREALGPEHQDTLLSMNNLAELYQRQGRHDEAESLYLVVLDARQRVLGPEASKTLTTINGLAFVYQEQGRHAKAEPLFTRLLESRRLALGEDHPGTCTAMDNLASLYREMGRLDDAETLHTAALETRRRVLGPEHPRTLTSMHNLAHVLMRLGRLDDAEPLLVETLELRRRVLGDEHPRTINTLANLAGLYEDQGRYEESEPLQASALDIRRRTLGPEHPTTLNSMANLAKLYRKQGRRDEAESLCIATLEARRRVLGEDHPDTLTSLANLARLHVDRARYGEAEAAYLRVLESHRELVGEEHPETLAAKRNLAHVYRSQERYDEAESLFRETLDTQRRVLGPEHPDTLNAMNGLATLLLSRGQYDEAEPLLVQALEAQRREGEDTPRALLAAYNMANLYTRQERYAEAEPLLREALQGSRRVLGETHLYATVSLQVLVTVLVKLEEFEEAEPLARDLVRIQRDSDRVGPSDRARSLHRLADILMHNGNPAEAEPLLRECLEILLGPPGQDDQQIANTQSLLGACLTALKRYEEAEALLLESYPRIESTEEESDDLARAAGQRIIDLYNSWGYPDKANEWRAKLPSPPGVSKPPGT